MKFVENGKCLAAAVYSKNADAIDMSALGEYCLHMRSCTGMDQTAGCTIPSSKSVYVFIGADNEFAKSFGVKVPREKFQDDTVYILVKDNYIVLDGGKRGKLYAVYEFLERFMGVRFYGPNDTYAPKPKDVYIPEQEFIYTPAITFRYTYTTDVRWSKEWASRMRVDEEGYPGALANLGVGYKCASPSCHTTFKKLLSPNDPVYGFDKHPEYFTYFEKQGKRVASEYTESSGFHWGTGDICWSNPEGIDLITERLKQWILDEPDKNVFDVSQTDWGNPCECPTCKEIAYKYGKDGEPRWCAQVIYLLNELSRRIKAWVKVDERVKGRDIYLQTMAYHKGEDAPVGMEVDDHVLIKLIIHGCYYHQIEDETCPLNNKIRKRIEDWGKLTKNLMLWDYANNFAFINTYNTVFRVIQKRMQYYAKHNIKGIFMEYTVSNEYPTTWFKVRAYLYCQLMWNPDLDFDKEYKMAMEYFYGAGAPMMMEVERRFQESIDADAERNINDPEFGQYHLSSAYVVTRDHYTEKFFTIGESLFKIAIEAEKNEYLNLNIRKEYALFKLSKAMAHKDDNYEELWDAIESLKSFGITTGKIKWFKDHFFGGEHSDFFVDSVALRNKKNQINKLLTERF